jgi:hypothetical protein
MPDLASQAIAMNEELRLLVGTRGGRVFECSALDPEDRSDLAGLEGVAIHALWASANGAAIVAFDANGRGLVWDRAERRILHELRSQLPVIQCAGFGPRDYVTLDNGGTGHIWSHAGTTLVSEPICDPPGVPLKFEKFGVPDDGRLVLIDGFRWRVWDRVTQAVTESHAVIGGLEVDNPSGDTGVSANGRFYYIYWDTYLVIDTLDGSVAGEHQVVVDPFATALSNDGRSLAIGTLAGAVVIAGPDGTPVFDDNPAAGVVVQVSIGANGRLATFVDEQGGAGCIDVEKGVVLIGRERMEDIIRRAER